MRCIASALSLLVISQSFWLVAAHDSGRLFRKTSGQDGNHLGIAVSASGELSSMETEYDHDGSPAILMDTRVSKLLSEVEALARSSAAPEASKIQVIKDIVTEELVPDLQETHAAAVKQVGDNHKVILKCNKNSLSTQQSIKSSTEVSVGQARTTHASCREEEKTKSGTKSSKCTQLDDFLNAINVPAHMPSGKPRAQMVEYTKTMSEYFCPKGPRVKELDDACTRATLQHATHASQCNMMQAGFELSFCTWRTELIDACSALETCYDDAVNIYDGHKAETENLVKKWKTEYAALQKIICYTDVWLNDLNAKTVDANQLDKCNSKRVDTSSMDVEFPDIPNKASCDLAPVQVHPGTPTFPKTEYSKFADQANTPIPCLRVPEPTIEPTITPPTVTETVTPR